MAKKFKQLGQGMTEYIIIVALIAVAAIAVYGFFGDTIRGQMGAVTQELAGTDGKASRDAATAAGASAEGEGTTAKGLGSYTGDGTKGQE